MRGSKTLVFSIEALRIRACHPRASIFLMKRQSAKCRVQNAKGQEATTTTPHSPLPFPPRFCLASLRAFVSPVVKFRRRLQNRQKGSWRGAHKVPMFGPSVCPCRRRTRRKPKPKAAWRMPHGHCGFAIRAVGQESHGRIESDGSHCWCEKEGNAISVPILFVFGELLHPFVAN